jgi:hypothetical protein
MNICVTTTSNFNLFFQFLTLGLTPTSDHNVITLMSN